jgi:hypothetical protein
LGFWVLVAGELRLGQVEEGVGLQARLLRHHGTPAAPSCAPHSSCCPIP